MGRVRIALDRHSGRLAEEILARLRGPAPADAVDALCASLSAELRAGAPPDAALLAAARDGGIAPRGRTAAALGEPVADALAADARATGSAALAGVAACWRAASHTGAGLAEGLDRVAALARAERRVRAELATETAAPKATARILGLLPLLGLLLGELLGAHPLQWLLGSPPGWVCLAAGSVLMAAGHLWARRILQQALPPTGRALR